ncbi:Endothelin-converting enzyme 1 [Porphyridium purpureum]|uniref:Endothelin-converting enzyme 1 n=1 Tax=Porphyridium purpureum TaxID=35688 RepID=A0A5J4Z785_PORPP|nr:Endothelin-converting enzyme 1 [Porphyridium purpureum]|eukprot:POR4425..scf295_1
MEGADEELALLDGGEGFRGASHDRGARRHGWPAGVRLSAAVLVVLSLGCIGVACMRGSREAAVPDARSADRQQNVFGRSSSDYGDDMESSLIKNSSQHPGHEQATLLRKYVHHPLHQILKDMDPTVDPCDDYYKYACGGWLKQRPLPVDRTMYFRAFDGADDAISDSVRKLMELPENQKSSKASIFYTKCFEKHNTEMSMRDLDVLDQFEPVFDVVQTQGADAMPVMKAIGLLHKKGITPWFYPDVDADSTNPKEYILYIGEGGLGLPDRSYYDDHSEASIEIRERYVDYLEYLLNLARTKLRLERTDPVELRALAEEILTLETQLAKLHPDASEQRNKDVFSKIVHVETFDRDNHPAFLKEYLTALGVYGATKGRIVIQFVPFFEQLGHVINDAPRKVIHAYIMSWILKYLAMKGALGSVAYDHDWLVYRHLLRGQKEKEPSWHMCVKQADIFFPDELNQLFRSRYLRDRDVEDARELISEIEYEFGQMLKHNNGWIDAQTRKNSLAKLKLVKNQIGYPKTYDSYKNVVVKHASYGDILIKMLERLQANDLAHLSRSLDMNQWYMTPNQVNAYYVAMRNSMTFPTGILQPPFYARSNPAPLKYGGVGAVMGHELTHAFDDHGSRYNGSGFMQKIWSDKSVDQFREKAGCLAKLYDGFVPEGLDKSHHVNGRLTLGEDIADAGGVRTAFRAMHRHLEQFPEDGIDEQRYKMSNNQFFFLQLAQTYCYQETLADKRLTIQTDPHPPGEFRVLGILSQFTEFGKEYKCKQGSRYYPEHTCVVWEG